MSKAVITPESKIEKESNTWLEKAKVIKIINQESLVAADFLAKEIKRHRTKTVEKELGESKASTWNAYQVANNLFNKYVNPLIAAEKAIKNEILVYNRKMEQIRHEAAEKAQREAEEAAQKERERLNAEAEKAADKGNVEEFERKSFEAEETTSDDFKPVTQPTQKAPTGTTIREKWVFEVTDLNALIKAVAEGKAPIDCLKANDVYIGQRTRSDKKNLKIPGVRVWDEGTVSMRTK